MYTVRNVGNRFVVPDLTEYIEHWTPHIDTGPTHGRFHKHLEANAENNTAADRCGQLICHTTLTIGKSLLFIMKCVQILLIKMPW